MGLFFKNVENDIKDVEERSILPMPHRLIPPRRDQVIADPETALTITSVFRCVQVIANSVSGLPLKTYRLEDRIDNPLIINNPSVYMNRREFLYQTMTSMVLYGEAFYLKQFGLNDQVNNIVLLHPMNVNVTQEPGKPVVYSFNDKQYTKAEVTHIKLFALPTSLRGVGPIQLCWEDIAASLNLRDYAAQWFSSAGNNSIVCT